MYYVISIDLSIYDSDPWFHVFKTRHEAEAHVINVILEMSDKNHEFDRPTYLEAVERMQVCDVAIRILFLPPML